MNRENKDTAPFINITPLIDILLVLLIIFMVISPSKASRFEAKIPAEPNQPIGLTPNPHTLIVSIDKDLNLSLNKQSGMGTASDASKLTTELNRIFQERRANGVFNEELIGRSDLTDDEKTLKTVFIKAPRSVQYGAIVKVMDAIKGAGASPIGLQIDDLER